MAWYFTKLIITAGIIVVISEISKRLPLLGSLIASLPLVSVLGMIWIYGETKDIVRIADHAEGTFGMSFPPCLCFCLCHGYYERVYPFHTLYLPGSY